MTTIIYLDCKDLGVSEQPFSLAHAEALLQYQDKRGISHWAISPDKGYIYKDGVISATGTGKDKKPRERGGDTGRA
jgi:hypothetical protein